MSDKLIALLMGVIAGLLLCVLAGIAFIVLGQPAAEIAPAAPPADAAIEAVIAEDYLSRAFMQNMGGGGAGFAIQDGRVDILPDNRLAFSAQVDSPVGLLLIKGAAGVRVQGERLAVSIADVRLGQLPLRALLKPFLPALEKRINDEANQQLAARLERANLRLVGLTSDETHLRAFLAGR